MLPAVIFPDVELLVVTYLRTALGARGEAYCSGVHVSNRLPNPRPARAVIVRRDGGPRLDATREAARLSVNVWSGTEQDASDLARMTRALLHTASTLTAQVKHVTDLGGPSPIADESGQPRRFFTAELIVTGANL